MTSLTELQTRQEHIDRQLAHAGWGANQRRIIAELHLPHTDHQIAEAGQTYRVGGEFADYALIGRDNKPIAVVEAKRSSRDALAGKRQAADYADLMRAQYGVEPFIFLSNGHETWFWDRERYPLRPVSGFFTLDDLERLAFQRQYRQPLSQLQPDSKIVDRLYQYEAISRVTEALEQGRRSFLLVMATGTGKTRTVIALIDLLIRAKWVERVLFLADRRELVRQALNDFKEHMPNEARARIEGGEVDSSARIHVATYPSMLQAYSALSPAYYDLVVADESHRSIYDRYKVLFSHFDALQVGLTATPTDYIDHNTFELFECPDGLPTFYFPYDKAVREGYLAQYRVLEAQTGFQLEGIKAGQLPLEVQQQLAEHGIELSEVDFEGSDLERRVTNSGTNDAIVQEFMERCRKDASGTLPAKSIIFAMSHNHAVELLKSFNRLYPDLQRRGMAEIIDSHMERADKTLDDFKHKPMPRVAISVDMLDTGIDVPAVQNLVFARPVFSQVKFWQMIGRGTRRWIDPETGKVKDDFLIIDHWNNFAYFNMQPEGEVAAPGEPLPTRLFRVRLHKFVLLRGKNDSAATAQTIGQLREMLDRLPHDNVNVRPHTDELTRVAAPEYWNGLDTLGLDHLDRVIAPLLRFLPDVNMSTMIFEVRCEHLAVAWLEQADSRVVSLRQQIIEDLVALPTNLREVQAQAQKLAWMKGGVFWEALDLARIHDLQITFAPLMRYRQRRRHGMIALSLPDAIANRRWVVYGPGGEAAFAESYRERAEVYVRSLADSHPAMIKLRQGQTLGEADVAALAEALNRPDLFVTQETLRQAFDRPDVGLIDLLRATLGLGRLPSREESITAAFAEFIGDRPQLSPRQIHFLRAIREAALRRDRLTAADLEQPPFIRIGSARRLFLDAELDEILAFANALAA